MVLANKAEATGKFVCSHPWLEGLVKAQLLSAGAPGVITIQMNAAEDRRHWPSTGGGRIKEPPAPGQIERRPL